MTQRTLILLCTLLFACEGQPITEPTPEPVSNPSTRPSAHDHSAHADVPSNPPMSGHSIYQLDSVWKDQRDDEVKLNAFNGDVVVLAMIYTHCQFACPRIISDMRRIRGALKSHDGISFVLVSIDPEHDTIERLRTFGEEAGLTKQGWTLLRGNDPEIRELAAVFGVQYRKTTGNDFAHSNVISVLNRKGEIVHQQKGLGTDPDSTIKTIEGLMKGDAEPIRPL